MSARKHCNSIKKRFFLKIRCLEQFFYCSSKFDALCCWIICHKETVSSRASICRNSRPNSSSLLCLTLLFLQTPSSAPMSFPDLKLQHNQIDFLWQWNDVYFIFIEIFKIKFNWFMKNVFKLQMHICFIRRFLIAIKLEQVD